MSPSLPLLLAAVLFGLTAAAAATTATIVVVDAGSSSSKISILDYDPASPDTTMRQRVPLGILSPGLSTFTTTDAVASCIKFKTSPSCDIVNGTVFGYITRIQFFLDANKVPLDANIHVLGTAGMRSLPASRALHTYVNLQAFFKRAYKPPLNYDHMRTLTGYEEALFGWITANVFPVALQVAKVISPANISTVLDLGGASAQITYGSAQSLAEGVVRVPIGASSVDLFFASFLGFGLDTAQLTFLNSRIEGSNILASGCFPAGTVSLATLTTNGWLRPASLSLLAARGIDTLIGTADMPACLLEWTPVITTLAPLMFDEEGNNVPAFFTAVPSFPTPNTRGPYIAIGAFNNVMSTETNLPTDTYLSYRTDIVAAFDAFCAPSVLNWTGIGAMAGTAATKQNAARRCMDFAHMRALIELGFGLVAPDTDIQLLLQSTSTWGPGAAYVRTLKQAAAPVPPAADTNGIPIASLVIISVVLVLMIAAGAVTLMRAQSMRTSQKMTKYAKVDARA
jgi:hypothetical protein